MTMFLTCNFFAYSIKELRHVENACSKCGPRLKKFAEHCNVNSSFVLYIADSSKRFNSPTSSYARVCRQQENSLSSKVSSWGKRGWKVFRGNFRVSLSLLGRARARSVARGEPSRTEQLENERYFDFENFFVVLFH